MISQFIYTSPYQNISIIQMHAVAPIGLGISGVVATFLVVTATMRMMIIVIILIILLILVCKLDCYPVLFGDGNWTSAVQKDVALLP